MFIDFEGGGVIGVLLVIFLENIAFGYGEGGCLGMGGEMEDLIFRLLVGGGHALFFEEE